MALSYEQLTMRMGFSGTEATKGMYAMRDKVRKEALDYVGFWEGALAKKDAAMAASDARQIATHKATQATLLKVTEARLAREAEIQAALGAGSIPENMVAGVASGAAARYGFNAAGKLVSVGGEAVKDAEKVGSEIHGMGAIIREISVVFHEGITGQWKRMLGSSVRLAALIGGSALLVGTGLVLAGTAAIVGPSAWRTYKARQAAAESEKDLKHKSTNEEELLRRRVEDLQRAGVITESEATAYQERLKNGDNAGVAIATNPLLKNGSAAAQAKAAEVAKEVAKIQETAAHDDLEAAREAMGLQGRRNSIDIERTNLLDRMSRMDQKSVEYAQSQLEVARLQKEEDAISNEQKKEKAELQKQYNEEHKKAVHIERDIDQIDFEAPTIAMLAGRRFNSRLDRAYGKGGRYDLESGNGPFAEAAQSAELAAKQQMWDIIHGNAEFNYNSDTGRNELVGGAAYGDLQRRKYAENLLASAGLDTPAMKQARMAEEMTQINNNIAEITRRATADGIVIRTDQ
jgi:hypothetical protein